MKYFKDAGRETIINVKGESDLDNISGGDIFYGNLRS